MSVLLVTLLMAAADPAPAAQTAAPEQKPRAERKICKTEEGHTGSRMSKRVCLTQTEWDRREAGVNVGDLKTMGAR
jgi:hypothetical protein